MATTAGVSVLSACSHAGVVNACLAAQAAFPDAGIDVVLGGYHLSGKAMEPRINPTVRHLRERVRPRVVAPGQCTGWRGSYGRSGGLRPIQIWVPDTRSPAFAAAVRRQAKRVAASAHAAADQAFVEAISVGFDA